MDIDENNRLPQHFCDCWLKFKRLVRGENLSEENFIMINQYGSENINSIGKAQATGRIYFRQSTIIFLLLHPTYAYSYDNKK